MGIFAQIHYQPVSSMCGTKLYDNVLFLSKYIQEIKMVLSIYFPIV